MELRNALTKKIKNTLLPSSVGDEGTLCKDILDLLLSWDVCYEDPRVLGNPFK